MGKLSQAQIKESHVAGVDVSYFDEQGIACAVLLSFPDLRLLGKSFYCGTPGFPYIPGFLALREGILCALAVRKLDPKPDLLFVDGAGSAHPYNYGLATFLEEELDVPTIGITKKPFVGEFTPPPIERGSFSYLYLNGVKIGAVLRTKDGVRELFVSPGKRLSIEEAVRWTLLLSQYRKPEPIRLAHQYSRLACQNRRIA
ncbi:MAG: endonuclease V [bacterium]